MLLLKYFGYDNRFKLITIVCMLTQVIFKDTNDNNGKVCIDVIQFK